MKRTSALLALACACVLVDVALAAPFDLGLTRNLPTGAGASGVVVDDFDRDGNLDFAVTQRTVDSVSVYLGIGAGKFGAPARYPTGDFPVAIAAGDLNADGRVDLVVANGAANTVSFYRGGVFGSFPLKVDFAVGISPTGVAVGDLNGDSRPDVAVSNAVSNSVTVLVGGFPPGLNGTKFTVPTGSGPRAVGIADLNRDGINELITANATADSVSVIPGTATGFGTRSDIGMTGDPSALAIGDLNTDGWPDIAVALSGGDKVVFLRNSNGTLLLDQALVAENNPDCVVIADVHADGAPDIVVGHSTSGLVTVITGGGAGVFTQPQSVSAGGTGVLALGVGDLDGDGRNDLVAPCLAPSVISVLYNNVSGPFGGVGFFVIGFGGADIAAADLNGDTHVDLAVTDRTSGWVKTFFNDGNGTFPEETEAFLFGQSGANAIEAADLNGDSKPDLAITTFLTGPSDSSRVRVFLNQGSGSFEPYTDYDVGVGGRVGLGVGDLTNDGKVDLVTGHQNSTVLQVLAGNGLGQFAPGSTLTTFMGPTTLHLADVNGSGLDVFVGGPDRVSALLANGSGGFGPKVDYVLDSSIAAIVHADFDEDGKMDLAAANAGGTVSILRGDGLGGFTNGATIPVPGAAILSLVAGDFNGDGDVDLVIGRADPSLVLAYGSGDGTFAPVPLFHGAGQVAMVPALLDGNGSPDLLVARAQTGVAMLTKTRTRTTLVVTPNPSAIGQSLSYQATVTEAQPDSSAPTGNVLYFDGTTLLGTVPVTNGVATLTQPGNYPWERKLSAVYGGDVEFLGSTSRTVEHVTYIPSVDVSPSVPEVSALALAPMGNPFSGPLRVKISLAGTEPARLSLLDVRGRVLETRAVAEPGIVELAPSRTLAPGVYLLRVEQDGKVAIARAVVL